MYHNVSQCITDIFTSAEIMISCFLLCVSYLFQHLQCLKNVNSQNFIDRLDSWSQDWRRRFRRSSWMFKYLQPGSIAGIPGHGNRDGDLWLRYRKPMENCCFTYAKQMEHSNDLHLLFEMVWNQPQVSFCWSETHHPGPFWRRSLQLGPLKRCIAAKGLRRDYFSSFNVNLLNGF